jgi:hypothetical protein
MQCFAAGSVHALQASNQAPHIMRTMPAQLAGRITISVQSNTGSRLHNAGHWMCYQAHLPHPVCRLPAHSLYTTIRCQCPHCKRAVPQCLYVQHSLRQLSASWRGQLEDDCGCGLDHHETELELVQGLSCTASAACMDGQGWTVMHHLRKVTTCVYTSADLAILMCATSFIAPGGGTKCKNAPR